MGSDRDRSRRDGEIGSGVGQRIVAVRRQSALADRIAADVAHRARAGNQFATETIAVGEPHAANGVCQCRVGIAIQPRFCVGSDRYRTRDNRQISTGERHQIVIARRERVQINLVGPDTA